MSLITNGFGVPNKQITNGLGINNVILHYISEQQIDTSCISNDYENSRNCIFGTGGFIKDKPLVKMLMMLCDYKKAKAYITSNELFIGKIIGVYKGLIGHYWFIELTSSLIARITNYYQSLLGYRDEDIHNIIDDINYLIYEFIYKNQKDIIAYIDIVPQNNKYSVGLSLCSL